MTENTPTILQVTMMDLKTYDYPMPSGTTTAPSPCLYGDGGYVGFMDREGRSVVLNWGLVASMVLMPEPEPQQQPSLPL